MTMLSDEELADALEAVGADIHEELADDFAAIRAHIDALTAQRDRARDIAVSLEQELARHKAHEAYFRGFQPPTTVEMTEQRAAMMATVDAAIEAKLTDPSRPAAPAEERTLDALLQFRVESSPPVAEFNGHTDNATGIRSMLATVKRLDENGRRS